MTNKTLRERIQEAGFTIEEVQISGTTQYRALREGDKSPACETFEELAGYLKIVDCDPIDDSELIDQAITILALPVIGVERPIPA